ISTGDSSETISPATVRDPQHCTLPLLVMPHTNGLPPPAFTARNSVSPPTRVGVAEYEGPPGPVPREESPPQPNSTPSPSSAKDALAAAAICCAPAIAVTAAGDRT